MSLSGADLAYTSAGTGSQVLLLIHGLGGNRRTWQHLIPALARDHTVIAPDLPGHGDSDPPAGDYSLGAHACAVRDLLLALGHQRATLVGHSLGGRVAMQAAYQFPERVDRLVLISSGGLGPEVAPILRAATLPGAETVVDWRGQTVSASKQFGPLRDVPVLLAWGVDDTTIPPHHHRTFAESVPHATMVEIPQAGHFPHETAPEQLLAAMEPFLATTNPFDYTEASWTDLLTQRQTRRTSENAATLIRAGRWGEVFDTHRNVDTAIGVLMELRGCQQRDAARELTLAGVESGHNTVAIAQDLVSLIAGRDADGGDASDPEYAAILGRWSRLIDARSTWKSTPQDDSETLAHIGAIRYGGVNDANRC